MPHDGPRLPRFMKPLAGLLLVTLPVNDGLAIQGVEKREQQLKSFPVVALDQEQRMLETVTFEAGIEDRRKEYEESLSRAGKMMLEQIRGGRTMPLAGGTSGEARETLDQVVSQFESKKEHEYSTAADFAKSLRSMWLSANDRSVEHVASILLGMVRATAHETSQAALQNRKGGVDQLSGALAAVEEINRLSWRYFVRDRPLRGQAVLQQVLDELVDNPDLESPTNILAISALLYNLGFLRLAVLGEYQSAADVLQQSYLLRVGQLGIKHPLSVEAVVSRGWALSLVGETEMVVEELIRSAEALSEDRPPTAERLLRQALQIAVDPLGMTTYAHACVSQHVNFILRGKTDGSTSQNAAKFTSNLRIIAREAALPKTHESVRRVKQLLARALRTQLQSSTDGNSLLEYSNDDIDQLQEEATALERES